VEEGGISLKIKSLHVKSLKMDRRRDGGRRDTKREIGNHHRSNSPE
jgi:hypothetical protein